jgi:hypothetical protein
MGLSGFPNADSHNLYRELPRGGLQAGTYLWMILFEILAVQEIPFIQLTYILQCLPTNEHTGP